MQVFDTSVVHITLANPVKDPEEMIPTEFALRQNYPNPFNPETVIEFSVKEPCKVSLKVYDIRGREVMTLVNEERAPGVYKSVFRGNKLASGIYFYRIRMKTFTDVKKMIVLE